MHPILWTGFVRKQSTDNCYGWSSYFNISIYFPLGFPLNSEVFTPCSSPFFRWHRLFSISYQFIWKVISCYIYPTLPLESPNVFPWHVGPCFPRPFRCLIKDLHPFGCDLPTLSVHQFPDAVRHHGIWTSGDYDLPSGYVKIAIENGHRNSGFTHEKLWFSIAMLVYQRV